MKGETREGLSNTLGSIIGTIRSIEMKHNGVASRSACEDLIQCLCIQRYLHAIFIESRDNAYSLLLGHRMIMTRLFWLKSISPPATNTPLADSNVEKSLAMRTCGEFASIIGLHIHIYRLATASLIACTESSCWSHIMDELVGSTLCHVLSPMINKVCTMFVHVFCFKFLSDSHITIISFI